MDSKTDVPCIFWEQIVLGKEIGVSNDFVCYRGSMFTPETNRRLPVCCKTSKWKTFLVTTDEMMHEAQVVLQLKGVAGVPQLYGITDTPPVALVMSLCPGRPLKQLQRPVSARTYLAAIRETCIVLGSVHRRGIVHNNISAFNILVVTRRIREDVSVSLVGFDRAEVTKDRHTMQADTDSLVFLMHEMADEVSESSWLYKHREKLRVQGKINLTGIVKILCSIMHEDPATCPKCKRLRPGN